MEFILNISEKYLEALKQIKGWTTVSDWAQKVGDLYPEILRKANKQSKSYKRPSTGTKEIAARIGAKFSTNAYKGLVDVDDSQKPRKVKFIKSKNDRNNKKLPEENKESYNRSEIIRKHKKSLNSNEDYRMKELKQIVSTLSKELHINFELDHAFPLKRGGEGNPDNMQILMTAHNRKKSSTKWDRFTIDEQIEYIEAIIKIQKKIENKIKVKINDQNIDLTIKKLRACFNKSSVNIT